MNEADIEHRVIAAITQRIEELTTMLAMATAEEAESLNRVIAMHQAVLDSVKRTHEASMPV
jgi:hypothetical protein